VRSAGVEATADGPADAPTGDRFAEAVALLARLPLTDTERAEAVRRLLTSIRGDLAEAGPTE